MPQSAFTVIQTRSQSDPALVLDPSNPSFNAFERPTRFKLHGIEFIRSKEVASITKREGKSLVWRYGEPITRVSDGRRIYYCYDCKRKGKSQKMLVLNGTNGALQHLHKAHRRDPKTGEPAAPPPEDNSFFNLVERKSFETFKSLVIQWIVHCQLALSMIERVLFRRLVVYLNSDIGGLLLKARSTLRDWIMVAFVKEKEELKAEMAQSLSKIHLSFDIWTAPSWISMICVWGYWVDPKGSRQRRLLAFRRIYRSHSGENQSAALLKVIHEYEIEERVGYFVCDNATANDSAVKSVLQSLCPRMSASDASARRLRCFGHIVNLAAQSLLSASDSEKRQALEDAELDELEYEKAARAWMVSKPVGKLHRIVRYILASPQRREEFAEITGPRKAAEFKHLGLLQDNATRWNSYHKAIGRALDVKERLIKFVRDHKPEKDAKYKPQQDRLSASDWRFLERLHDCLDAYFWATKTNEGYEPVATSWFQTLHFLLNEIDGWKQEAEGEGEAYLATSLAASWNKIEKYYQLADSMPAYYAAIVLDPKLKMHWFREQWQDQENTAPWIAQTEERVRSLWRTQYKGSSSPPTRSSPPRHGESMYDRMTSAKRLKRSKSTAPLHDELDQYLALDPEASTDPTSALSWWLARRASYPRLSRMALDILSIPLMSDDKQRSFSSGRDMITYRRTRLQSDIIEACQCLKSWQRLPEDITAERDEIEEQSESGDEF